MTECPKCKGYGIVGSAVPDILRGRGAIFSSNECDMCHGSGEVQMTEQEYLQTCNTEQLANAFFEYRYVNATPRQKLWMSASEKCIKTDIMGWLKQPHTNEVEK